MSGQSPESAAAGYARRGRPRTVALVVAPHPDDDAIGCGGMLARLARRGARVAATYVTDGSASHPRSTRYPAARLRDVREAEARAALRRLGIRTPPQFLRAPDGGLGDVPDGERVRLVCALARRIRELRANVVFAPWLRDPHPDHVATAAIVRDAVDACARRVALYSYRVWLPVRGDAAGEPRPGEAVVREIRLTPAELDCKRAAIGEHRSQAGGVVDDDPSGFVIGADLLAIWLAPVERFYRRVPLQTGTDDSW